MNLIIAMPANGDVALTAFGSEHEPFLLKVSQRGAARIYQYVSDARKKGDVSFQPKRK